MILAGDIGGTKSRLAAFETDGNRLKCVVEKIYPSKEHGGLNEIVADFVKTEGIPAHSACFGVAGPVTRRTQQDFELAVDHRLARTGSAVATFVCGSDQ